MGSIVKLFRIFSILLGIFLCCREVSAWIAAPNLKRECGRELRTAKDDKPMWITVHRCPVGDPRHSIPAVYSDPDVGDIAPLLRSRPTPSHQEHQLACAQSCDPMDVILHG